jgi:acyl-CoA dehydrogenase
MDFSYSDRVQQLRRQLMDFMDSYVMPRVGEWKQEVEAGQYPVSFMDDLKALAREEGLWNLFLPSLGDDEPGTRLSNLEYAPLAEIMGRVPWSSEVFNCNAPDTGNMEVLHMFGSEAQKRQWLEPLLNGEIRSAFAMTEPDSSSSDASNIQCSIRRDGDEYLINGRKWFITNAHHPNCRIFIVMGKTDPEGEKYRQQSMILVPADTPGVELVRNITTLNHRSPEGHSEVLFRDVRVPAENLIAGGGGRLPHCPGTPRTGTGAPLHARHRHGGTVPGAHGGSLPRAHDLRQAPVRTRHDQGVDGAFAHRDRAGAPAGAENRGADR